MDIKSFISLQAEDNVWAMHPTCEHIHSGKILAYHKDNIYFVKFHKP